ncbi:sensor histidine kinase [Spirillospora sp. NPDC029432]|uniref:sensor histidine kinase n=1 Tax=Spirillospora sp. NPDC029432 TaxID=3154599 RepID=UPI003451EEB2
MSSADPTAPLLAARLGQTFRLLMKVRILVAAVSLLLVPRELLDTGAISVVVCMMLLSLVLLLGWEQIVPSLMRYPLLVVLDVVISYGILEVGGVVGPFFFFTVVTSMLAGLLYRRLGMMLVCVLQVLLYLVAVAQVEVDPTFQTFVGMPALYPIGGFIGRALRQLLDANEELDTARRRAEVVAAAAEERGRLAREMHDSLAKTLRGISMAAGALPAWVRRSPERAEEEALRVASAAEIAFREARQLLTDLRDDAVQGMLAQAVPEVVASWEESAGVTATVTADPGADLPLVARHELLAILREALENVDRHARARAVEVRLAARDGQVVLTVRDDGRGFSMTEDEVRRLSAAGHYGVIGMRERAERAGGTLAVTAGAAGGTTVTLTVPMTSDLVRVREPEEAA